MKRVMPLNGGQTQDLMRYALQEAGVDRPYPSFFEEDSEASEYRPDPELLRLNLPMPPLRLLAFHSVTSLYFTKKSALIPQRSGNA